MIIDQKSKVLFWVFAFLLAGSILFSYHRFLIKRNFFIDISQVEEVEESAEETDIQE